jgi:hypothetical protein
MAAEKIATQLKELEETPPWEWPREAGHRLMNILRDRGNSVLDRTTAAELASNTVVMNDGVAGALLSIVQRAGEPDELRARAAISLGPVLEQTDIDEFDDDVSEPLIGKVIFDRIRETLREIYSDEGVPKLVRRRILEASVRAVKDWHTDAIRAAAGGPDEDWKLTAAFCMQYVRGFDSQILELLDSGNPDIHYEAIRAAGTWELEDAWEHVAALLTSKSTEKPLLLAAIEAAASIRPQDAGAILAELADSDDEEIAEAAAEAMMMAEPGLGDAGDWDEDEDEDDDSHP